MVLRATRYVRAEDRATVVEALAHPDSDYCQNALKVITEQARQLVERVYKRTARVVARTKRTAPALKRLKWATWAKRRGATRAAMVMKVWSEERPEALWELFPPKVKRDMAIRRVRDGELEEVAARTSEGTKAFRVWAPEIYNRVARGEDPWSGSDDEKEEDEVVEAAEAGEEEQVSDATLR